MAQTIRIRLEVYLPFRGHRIWRGEEQISAGTTLEALMQTLAIGEGELAVLVNGRHVDPATLLRAGDEVAVLRQAEGG